MPETFFTLPDGKRIIVFETRGHPDISGIVNLPLGLKADIPTYQISAESVTLASGKNLLSIFNNLSGNRIRVQNIFAYPNTSGNNSITVKLHYINSVLSGGTDAAIDRFAADFPVNPSAPNNVQARVGNTLPVFISGIILGGNRIGLNTVNRYEIFSETRNGSALQLRPEQDGISVVQKDGNANGTLNIHAVVTLD